MSVLACSGERPNEVRSSTPMPSPPRFVDGTASAGIEFAHESGARGRYFLPEIIGSGCAVFDYDGDGDLDLFFVQGSLIDGAAGEEKAGPTHRLFRSELAGGTSLRFIDVTTDAGVGFRDCGMGCAVGDVDGDGHRDLYITAFGPNRLLRNRGDGKFGDVTDAAGLGDSGFSTSASFLDYDRDGDLDLFVARYVDYAPAEDRECTRLGGRRDYCGPLSYAPISDRLFRNEGDGTFTDVSVETGIAGASGYGLGLVSRDFDGDGWVDVFVANDASPNHFWRNRGGRRFENVALELGVSVNGEGRNEAGMGVAAADFDRDGQLDLFLTHERGESNTLYEMRDGYYVDATTQRALGAVSRPFVGFGTVPIDFDRDGWLDIFVANGAVRKLPNRLDAANPYVQPDRLYRRGAERFTEVSAEDSGAIAELHASRGAATGDLDQDGDVDIVVTSNRGQARILLDDSKRDSNWVSLELVGRPSNRDAYGARVRIDLASGGTVLRWAGTDGSYLSASSPRLVVGLGKGVAERITVAWLSGAVETWTAIPSRSRFVLREGSGSRPPE